MTNTSKQIRAEVITIGDEILYGQILDTNTQWISQELDAIGVQVVRRTTVGDNEEDILSCFSAAEEKADIILITGGLGPTSDDLTKPMLARYFNTPLVLNQEALIEIEALFAHRGRLLNELNKGQAMLPEACQKISNPIGTAPGMWFEKSHKVFVSMPGVPHEMKKMMKDHILPRIKQHFNTPIIYHRIVRTAGVPESVLAEKIQDWEKALPSNIKLAYLPGLGQVRLRLTSFGSDLEKLKEETEIQIQKLLPLLGHYAYGYDDDKLEEVIGKLLKEKGLSLSLAESCSGGYITHLITTIPGASRYFRGAVVPYHNDLKNSILGVKNEVFQEVGAVSEETVLAMATGVRKLMKADIGLASSGIAGPDGGSEEKPVGTVWIAINIKGKSLTKKLQLSKDRMLNIQLTALAILNLLRQTLSEID